MHIKISITSSKVESTIPQIKKKKCLFLDLTGVQGNDERIDPERRDYGKQQEEFIEVEVILKAEAVVDSFCTNCQHLHLNQRKALLCL